MRIHQKISTMKKAFILLLSMLQLAQLRADTATNDVAKVNPAPTAVTNESPPSQATGTNTAPSTAQNYHLVWSDNFAADKPGLPDPSKWNEEEGYIRNNEAQFYTRSRLENARVENGRLIIEARKERYLIPSNHKKRVKFAPYTSASLLTSGKNDWLYGRIEIRAKMPTGIDKGVWPTLWTLGTSRSSIGWPKCGEIDLLEMFIVPHCVRGNFHFSKDGKLASRDGGSLIVADSDTKFHTYVMDWTSSNITLSVDGNVYAHMDTIKAEDHGYNPFQHPHYLLLNLALGGSTGGSIDDSCFLQRMEIESVKVYQTNPASSTKASRFKEDIHGEF